MINQVVEFSPYTRMWHHNYSGRKSRGYASKREAAKDYVRTLIQREPKYKPLVNGKPWSEIFKIVGISMDDHQKSVPE